MAGNKKDVTLTETDVINRKVFGDPDFVDEDENAKKNHNMGYDDTITFTAPYNHDKEEGDKKPVYRNSDMAVWVNENK